MNAQEKRERLSHLLVELRDALADGLFSRDSWNDVTVDNGSRLQHPANEARQLCTSLWLMIPDADEREIQELAAQYQGIDLHAKIDAAPADDWPPADHPF